MKKGFHMFDILCDIFKNPGASFSPMPFWFWNDRIEEDELLRQIDDFHKKGIDGLVIHPRMGFSVDGGYLSEEYFRLIGVCLAAMKKRRMLLVLYDDGMYPSGSAHGMVVSSNPLYAARCLYARPTGSYTLAPGEEAEMRMALHFTDGLLDDVLTDVEVAPDDYQWYDFILGFTGGTMRGLSPDEDDNAPHAPLCADLLNPEATSTFITCTHEAYFRRFGEDFGQTIIGFFTDEPSLTGRCAHMEGRISWTYDFHEAFGEAGGNALMLASLLFPTREKRISRDAEYIYQTAIRRRLGDAYYGILADWCLKHGVALMGHPANSHDIGLCRRFHVPGQDLVWRMVEPGTELTAYDSVLAKCASDTARHSGLSRSSCECFGVCGKKENPWDFTAADMLWYVHFLTARGINMLFPHAFYYSLKTSVQWEDRPPDVGPGNIWWSEYRVIANYCKRLCWLNTTNTNNPAFAVLTAEDNIPVQSVRYLYENGYSFNYVSMDELKHAAHIHDGKIRIDRYSYSVLLVDSRIRLDAETVTIIGRFVTEGGKMVRSGDFSDYIRKHGKKTSYFDRQCPALRFVHLTKSGYPFFFLVNESDEEITGNLITDIAGAAYRFDAFTGNTTPVCGKLHTDGFAYPVRLGPREAVILGLNTDTLPLLGETPDYTICEIVALSDTRRTFSYTPAENRRCILRFQQLHDRADITVNGHPAGTLLWKPWEIDITPYLTAGENTVAWQITGSMANLYGTPVPVGAAGITVEISDTHPNAISK